MLFRHGINAKQAQMWLGHHSPAFTLATYVHLLADDLPDPSFLDTLTQGAAELSPPAITTCELWVRSTASGRAIS